MLALSIKMLAGPKDVPLPEDPTDEMRKAAKAEKEKFVGTVVHTLDVGQRQ